MYLGHGTYYLSGWAKKYILRADLVTTKIMNLTLTFMMMLWARVPVIFGSPLPGKNEAAIPDQGPNATTTTLASMVTPSTTTPTT
jgi:hypothetical protein